MNALATSRRQLFVLLPLAGAALWLAMALSPPERSMGSRIALLYLHAGAAWTSYLAYGLTAVGALGYLRHRTQRWDWLSLSSAEVGVLFTTLTLVSGSLWARSTQGWWWIWEPRLTLTLLLWFVYAGYLLFRQSTPADIGASLGAAIALLGVPVAVLNHFAVQIYRTFHPEPVILRPEGPALGDARYVVALAVGVVACGVAFAALLLARLRLEEGRAELRSRWSDRGPWDDGQPE